MEVLNEYGNPVREHKAVIETEMAIRAAAGRIGKVADQVPLQDARILFEFIAQQEITVLASEYILLRQTNQRRKKRGAEPIHTGWPHQLVSHEQQEKNDGSE